MNPNILFTHMTAAAASAYILALLQQWEKIPWITKDTVKVNAAIRIVMSIVATLGISTAWNAGAGGEHTLTIVIPPLAVLGQHLWHAFGQYALQHGWLNVLNPTTASVPSPAAPKQP